MKDFIQQYMEKPYQSFLNKIESSYLCSLQRFTFAGGNLPQYNNELIQDYYLLKYFAAYLCEYNHLYRNILKDKKLDSLNILSIGCGSFIDYYASYFALGEKIDDITYTGIDEIDWNYKDSLNNQKVIFKNTSAASFQWPEKAGYNVIIFPKSISEISENDLDTLVNNAYRTRFTSKYIYLATSIMTSPGRDPKKHARILEGLDRYGFRYKNHQLTQATGDPPCFDKDFHPPKKVIDLLKELHAHCKKSGECENIKCKDEISKNPILTTKYVNYKISLLERK